MIIVWTVVSVIFLIVEALTTAMCAVWFVVGAGVALVTAALGGSLWLQITLFVVVSGICLVLIYPQMKKMMNKDTQATNADMALGSQCVVTQRIDNLAGTGTVSLGGKTWTARSSNGEIYEEGAVVVVQSIQGVKLIVCSSAGPQEEQNHETSKTTEAP